MARPVVAKNPWGRPINHRTPTAPKGQNEIAQGRAKRRPGYGKRDGSIGSLTLSEPFGQNLGGFRGRQARNKQDLLQNVRIEKRGTLKLPQAGHALRKSQLGGCRLSFFLLVKRFQSCRTTATCDTLDCPFLYFNYLIPRENFSTVPILHCVKVCVPPHAR